MRERCETTKIDSARDAVAYLEDQCWHDSILHEVVLVRTKSLDQVVLKLDLLQNVENQLSQSVEVAFCDCLDVRIHMNWGVQCLSGGEMIYSAECLDSDGRIDRVRAKWGRVIEDLGNLGAFRLNLASTGSTIEVVFGCIIIKHSGEIRPHDAPPPRRPSGGG